MPSTIVTLKTPYRLNGASGNNLVVGQRDSNLIFTQISNQCGLFNLIFHKLV